MSEDSQQKNTRTLSGRVISDKMNQTVSVAIERRVQHPMYGKYIRKTSKVLAHDETNQCRAGDKVTIAECRPISKHKSWRIVDVLERAITD
jgi:small subunit ribosomal protein S17